MTSVTVSGFIHVPLTLEDIFIFFTQEIGVFARKFWLRQPKANCPLSKKFGQLPDFYFGAICKIPLVLAAYSLYLLSYKNSEYSVRNWSHIFIPCLTSSERALSENLLPPLSPEFQVRNFKKSVVLQSLLFHWATKTQNSFSLFRQPPTHLQNLNLVVINTKSKKGECYRTQTW